MILSLNNIYKEYGDNLILNDVSMLINDKEKVALIGDNGSGKTTLLNIIANEDNDYTGNINLSPDTTIGYLKQMHDFFNDNTIIEEMYSTISNILDIEKQMDELSILMHNQSGVQLDDTINKFDNLRHKYELLDGYSAKSKIKGILVGLGFSSEEFDTPINKLSGGEKTRLYLAKLLVIAPKLIILDEPTNHLDLNAIEWLENYISTYNGCILVVSHDRYFLDKVCTKVISIENKKLVTYDGNYTSYTIQYEQLLNANIKAFEKNKQIVKHNEDVIAKLRSFNREKSIKRAESRQKLLDKIEILSDPTKRVQKNMNLEFLKFKDSGKDVLKCVNLSKSFAKPLFSNINFEIKRGEHIAIIGENGSGKTTLLKIINNLLSPDSGYIELGSDVFISYYDQEHNNINNNNTIFDEISNSYPTLTNTQIRNLLAGFSFKEDEVFNKIASLSGGEKGRVSLCKLMIAGANFIILDEPTNHLDMSNKQTLENAINKFDGTVLYVSHDRYFINSTATRILEIHENRIDNYIGNYDYYLEKKDTIRGIATYDTVIKNDKNNSSHNEWKEYKKHQAQINKISNLFKKCEKDIEDVENKLMHINEQFNSPDISFDVDKLIALNKEKELLDNQLADLYIQWEEYATFMEEHK